MASSASDAGHKEKELREQLVKTGDVDVMISIGTNFFYTRSLPCTLWFFDKGKPEQRKNKTLMIDARSIYRKVTRKIYDFTPEQLDNISTIVWLYRGETEKYLGLVQEYLQTAREKGSEIENAIKPFEADIAGLLYKFDQFFEQKRGELAPDEDYLNPLHEKLKQFKEDFAAYQKDREVLTSAISDYSRWFAEKSVDSSAEASAINTWQKLAYERFLEIEEKIKGIQKQIDHLYKGCTHVIDYIEKEMDARKDDDWDNRAVSNLLKDADEHRKEAVEILKETVYFHHQVKWLEQRFPEAAYDDVEGLCKLVDTEEIEQNDWSLTPGRYVGVAPQKEEDFDIEERLQEIHIELRTLNEDAEELGKIIQRNFEGLTSI